jgi:ABC-type transport system substrate-binding protein
MEVGKATEISGIRAVDRYTVRFTLTQPLGHFLALLTMPPAFVLAREEVDKWGADYVSHPVRTGPHLGFNHAQKPFNDVRVRRAFACAILRRQILEAIFNGRGVIARGPIPPGLPGYTATHPPLPHDPSRAKALLAEAGYGTGLEVELLLTPTTANRRIFDVFQASLRGANTELKPCSTRPASCGPVTVAPRQTA